MRDDAEIHVLAHERTELLACTLAGVCGFNAGVGPVHVIDDGSRDPRIMRLLARYKEAGLIESVERRPHGGIGQVRRRMIDRFLDGKADRLVQVEADMLIGPGQIKALVDAYRIVNCGLKNGASEDRNLTSSIGSPQSEIRGLHFLNAFHHFWVRPQLKVLAFGEYRVGITRGGSEPFWTSDRASLQKAVAEGLIPAVRPDLVLWLDRLGGATLYQPEISCQHLGAGKASIYYPDFAWQNVVFRQENERLKDSGPLRQPYPEHPLAWPQFEAELPQSALRLYEYLRRASPVPLPEMPA